MMPVAWSALVAVDLLNMMRFYHLATERTRGDADALFARSPTGRRGCWSGRASTAAWLAVRPPPGARCAGRGAGRAGGSRLRRPAVRSRARSRAARRLPLRRLLPARGRVGQRRPATQAQRPGPAAAVRAVRRVPGAVGPARRTGGGHEEPRCRRTARHSARHALRDRPPGARGAGPRAVGVLARHPQRRRREPRSAGRLPVRRVDPDHRQRPAHLAHQAGRRRGRGGAARLRAGPGGRGAAAPPGRRRPAAALRVQRRRPHRRGSSGRLRLAAPLPRAAALGRAAALVLTAALVGHAPAPTPSRRAARTPANATARAARSLRARRRCSAGRTPCQRLAPP